MKQIKDVVNFTIIIPVYNVENFISTCLDSIIDQGKDYSFEIIAVNDASPDGSLEKLRSYESSLKGSKTVSLKIINLNQNSGPAIARNQALKVAKGEYIFFIDGDDYITENAFEVLTKSIIEYKPDVLLFPYRNWREENNTFEELFPADKRVFESVLEGDLDKHLKLSAFPELLTLKNYVCTKLYRTDFLREHAIIFPDLRLHEDVPFHWEVLMQSKSIVVLKEPLYIHRIFKREDGQQASNVFNKQRFDIFEALNTVEKIIQKDEFYISEYYKYFLIFKLDVLSWVSNHIPENLYHNFNILAKESLVSLGSNDFDKETNDVLGRLHELSHVKPTLTSFQKSGVNLFGLLFKPLIGTKQQAKLKETPIAFFKDSKNKFTRSIGKLLNIS